MIRELSILLISLIIGVAFGFMISNKRHQPVEPITIHQIDTFYLEKQIIKTKYQIKNERDTIYINRATPNQLIELRAELRRSMAK